MTMELSMTIALLSALAIGQFFTALVIAFFVLFAELLDGYTVGSGRRAIGKLINALPRHVTVRRDGQESELRSCRPNVATLWLLLTQMDRYHAATRS
jgi:cation transport ATPase